MRKFIATAGLCLAFFATPAAAIPVPVKSELGATYVCKAGTCTHIVPPTNAFGDSGSLFYAMNSNGIAVGVAGRAHAGEGWIYDTNTGTSTFFDLPAPSFGNPSTPQGFYTTWLKGIDDLGNLIGTAAVPHDPGEIDFSYISSIFSPGIAGGVWNVGIQDGIAPTIDPSLRQKTVASINGVQLVNVYLPEPSSIAVMATALLLLGFWTARRRAAA